MRRTVIGCGVAAGLTCALAACGGSTAPDPVPPTIATSTLPGGVVGVAYAATLSATGGQAPYTWSATGTLPDGLSLSAGGEITGTPTTSGTSDVDVSVQGADGASSTGSVSITIDPAPIPPTITTAALPDGAVAVAYNATLEATGGVTPYTWSLTGSLPDGLSLGASGELSGTPTTEGTSTFTIDVEGDDGASSSMSLSITIGPIPVLAISTTSILPASIGVAYSADLVATGGDGSYTWQISAGQLPSGFSLADATISGTSSTPETETFTVEVASGDGQVVTQQLTLPVANVLGRWVDTGGNVVSGPVTVGTVVHFQLCYLGSDMAAFQGTVSGFGMSTTTLEVQELDATGTAVPVVHPDCANSGADIVDTGFQASGTTDPITALVVSQAAGPGAAGDAPSGLFWIELETTAAGQIEMDVSGLISSDFSGSPLTLVVGAYPLTVN